MFEKKLSVLGMLVIVLALSLVFLGCITTSNNVSDQQNNEPKTIRITGFDGSQGTLLISESANPSGWWPPFGYGGYDDNANVYRIVEWIGRWDWWELNAWMGTGKFYIIIQYGPARDPSKDGANYVYSEDGINPALVEIKDALTILEWSKFIWLFDVTEG